MAKKNIMREFRIDEISGVDSPAQKGATVTIMKRDAGDGEAAVEKRAALTTAVQGHTHLIVLDREMGDIMPRGSGTTSHFGDHSHPWVVNKEGKIVIGEAMGHTHDIAEMGVHAHEVQDLIEAANKRDDGTKEVPMADGNTTEKSEGEQRVQALEAELAVAKAVGEMNDAQKAHYATLDDAGKKEFLAKSKDERQAVVDAVAKAASEADPVVYKAADGTEFRKSDDPRLVTMARQLDEDRKALAKARATEEHNAFVKQAETDLAHLPGSVEVRTAIVRAVTKGIDDEKLRGEAISALKAHNAKLAPAFTTVGTGAGVNKSADAGSRAEAEAQLDELAKQALKADPKLGDFYAAYEKVAADNPELVKLAVAG